MALPQPRARVRRRSSGALHRAARAGIAIERKLAREERERLREAQADLAHINRVTTMGELTASLAHEVNQPIAAAATDANTCLRWLARDQPDLEEARAAASRVVKDAARAAEIMSRIRSLFKKELSQRELVDVNEIIRGMVELLRSEATRYSISVRTELSEDLPQIMGDRVQLQQVTMNLIINSIDAMKHFLQLNLTAPAWDCGSAAPSLNRMVGACGLPPTLPVAHALLSLSPPKWTAANDNRNRSQVSSSWLTMNWCARLN